MIIIKIIIILIVGLIIIIIIITGQRDFVEYQQSTRIWNKKLNKLKLSIHTFCNWKRIRQIVHQHIIGLYNDTNNNNNNNNNTICSNVYQSLFNLFDKSMSTHILNSL